jgi:hypothetical protein
MPEIAEQPKTANIIGNDRQTPRLSETYESIFEKTEKGTTPDEIEVKLRAFYFKEQLKQTHPKTPEIVIDNISQIYLGPLLLSPEALRGEGINNSEKELSARIQHHFTHLSMYASEDNADESFRKRYYESLLAMEKSANSRIGRNLEIRRFLNGIKTEIAVIRTLHEHGFEVYIPDYISKSDADSGITSETMDWDVKFGTDLVGVSPEGDIFLVDAKGRKYLEDKKTHNTELNTQPQIDISDISGKTPDSLQKLIDEIQSNHPSKNRTVKKARIVIPTGSDFMTGLKAKTENNTYQEIFHEYGAMTAEAQNSIIQGLKG